MAAGRFECPCDRQRRVEETGLKSARMPRPWHWEDPRNAQYRGCGEAPAAKTIEEFDGRKLDRCPSRVVEPWAWEVVWLWKCWEQGSLPDSGGVMDQSAALLDAVRVIGSAVAEEQSRQSDEGQRRMEAQSRAAEAKSRSARRR